MPAGIFLKSKALAASGHRLLARSARVSRAYLAFWALLLRALPRGAAWEHVFNALKSVAWPIDRLPPRTCRCVGARHELRFVPHPGMLDFQAYFTGQFEYEPEVLRFLEGHLPEIDRVIEIGANVGIHSLFAARCFAERGNGRVYAFEPSPRAFRALLDNLIANDASQVTPLNAAVFTGSGLAEFFEPVVAVHEDLSLTRSSLVERHARYGATHVRSYPVFTVGPEFLEALFTAPGRVLVKIDIEGAEPQVLEALRPLLERHRPGILLEALHGRPCDELNRVEFVPALYRLFHLTDTGPVEQPRFMGDPSYRLRDYFLSPR